MVVLVPGLLWKHVTHVHWKSQALTERILPQGKVLTLTPINSVYLNDYCLNHIHQTITPISRICIMGAKKAKNHKPRLAVSIPPPPTDVTAEQYIAAMKA